MVKYIFNIKTVLLKLSFKSFLFIILVPFILTSCTNKSPEAVSKFYAPLEDLYGFDKELVKGGDFWITTYQKITNKNEPFVFYIEGDGLPFNGKYSISKNPTPRRQMFIKLASMDSRPNVVYVARPCQYTPMELNPKCQAAYWTDNRLSDDSVDAMNQVINKINNNSKFSLVGYSGGGGIVILIAARNPKVRDIITVAGNLDHRAFTKYHNVLPMIGSLNPIDFVQLVNHIPQWHLSGGKDNVIPPFIADKFVEASNSNCVKQTIFPNNTHKNGWEKIWGYIYTKPLTCGD